MTNTIRIDGPADLIRVVPHLVGFYPSKSLVLIGFTGRRIRVTARLDIADVQLLTVHRTLASIKAGGADRAVAIFFDDLAPEGALLPHEVNMAIVTGEAVAVGIEITDGLYVSDGRRYWSYVCGESSCCPPEGKDLPMETTEAEAAMVAEGFSPEISREELARRLAPIEPVSYVNLDDALAPAATLSEYVSAAKETEPILPERLTRLAGALLNHPLRDAVWLAVDAGELDGLDLWLEMARRVESPANVPALFLAAWRSYRSGDGTFANVIVEHIQTAVGERYSAANLLAQVLTLGINPATLPRLVADEFGMTTFPEGT